MTIEFYLVWDDQLTQFSEDWNIGIIGYHTESLKAFIIR